MDELLKKLKKRSAYPFETIAIAIGFSPRLEGIISQAKLIADALNSNLLFIHIGDKTPEKEEKLNNIMKHVGVNINKERIIWAEGETVDTILKLCKLNVVDLLILGAMEKENLLKFYLGSVARKISRRAKCSVLMLTHPTPEPKPFRKIVVNGIENQKTIHSLNAALYLAKHFQIKEITVVKEVHLPALAMTMADSRSAPEASKIKKGFSTEEENKLLSMIEKSNADSILINEKTVNGKPGYAISKYAKQKKADLLVINSPDTHLNLLDRIFTHDIEYILADLPCNLLIIHSRP